MCLVYRNATKKRNKTKQKKQKKKQKTEKNTPIKSKTNKGNRNKKKKKKKRNNNKIWVDLKTKKKNKKRKETKKKKEEKIEWNLAQTSILLATSPKRILVGTPQLYNLCRSTSTFLSGFYYHQFPYRLWLCEEKRIKKKTA